MATQQIDPTRIQVLNDAEPCNGDYVLYLMQQSQRVEFNHALEHAVRWANELDQRLLVVFGLTDDYPKANLRHYQFMLEGLSELAGALKQRRIKFVVQRGDPAKVAVRLARKASCVICDRGYLRHQKAWRRELAVKAKCRVEQVEADVVVPVEVASGKAEYAARTLRPKLQKLWDDYLVALRSTPLKKNSLGLPVRGFDVDDPARAARQLELDRSVGVIEEFQGGTQNGKKRLRRFLKNYLGHYAARRGEPQEDVASHMSMYLHFGQISPVYVALQVRGKRGASRKNKQEYLEELLVRRELAQNFVHFTRDYDKFSALPDWARRTLRNHQRDRRPHRYSRSELEGARTHDPYWNAAMNEMLYTGYMHNHMRMYWGKKILEWSNTPEYAFRTALYLNNKYFIDGRDANSFANVAWVFGLHDRPWGERKIFGTVRYMSAQGLERKVDIDGYVQKIEKLAERHDGQ